MAARESAYVWAKNIHAFVFYISFSVMELLPAVSFRQNEYIFGGAKLPNNFWKFILYVYDWCLLKFKNDLVTRLRLNINTKIPEATLKENEPATEEEFGSMEENVGGYRTRSRSGSNKRHVEEIGSMEDNPNCHWNRNVHGLLFLIFFTNYY